MQNGNGTWADALVLPDYAGGSIANIPATAARMLGRPLPGLPPLRDSYWKPVSEHARRVIVIIIDALGANLVKGNRPVMRSFLERAQVNETITSVFPSTTVNALSSIWTGAPTGQHGLAGLRLFFPDLGVIGQMIHFTPNFYRAPDALVKAGIEPTHFLKAPGAPELMSRQDIATGSYKSYEFIGSALSEMHNRGVTDEYGGISWSDILIEMRRTLEQSATEDTPQYLVAYWHTVDTLSHRHGPFHEAVAAELEMLVWQLQTELLDRLSPAAADGTVLFLTGDHGQVPTPSTCEIYLADHPALARMLFMRPAGEPRVPYLYTRRGAQGDVLDYFAEHWPRQFTVLPAEEALACGLFGPAPFMDRFVDRIGDLVVIGHDGFTLMADGDNFLPFQGRHGSLVADEMEVAWIGLRANG